jgi:hypothetical protein
MDTQILNLNAPYEYIYCNGSIGLHIATMIVYEAGVNDDGEYVLETHSHPVVKYSNRPGGTVWNRAELTDCHVLCREDKKLITMEQFYNFVSDTRHLGGDTDTVVMPISMEAPLAKLKLDQHGIRIVWPVTHDEKGLKMLQEDFDIALEFKRNSDDELCDYSCYDMGVSDQALYTGAEPLYFFARFNTKEELKTHLINSMSNYYRMFKDHEFRINYFWPKGSEFADVIHEVNQMEPEIRKKSKESNDIDV